MDSIECDRCGNGMTLWPVLKPGVPVYTPVLYLICSTCRTKTAFVEYTPPAAPDLLVESEDDLDA